MKKGRFCDKRLIVRRVLSISFFCIVTYMVLSQESSADIVALRSGEEYQGKIIDAKPNHLLFATKEKNKVCVMSFEMDKIHKIEVTHFEFSEKFASIKLKR